MSNNNYLNDPRLTAYLLGELEADEMARIAEWLETSPQGREQLQELQATTDTLFAALQQQSAAITPQRNISAAIQQALALPKEVHQPQPQLSMIPAKPKANKQAGSAVLATFGTVAALLLVGLVCLPRGDAERTAKRSGSDDLGGIMAVNDRLIGRTREQLERGGQQHTHQGVAREMATAVASDQLSENISQLYGDLETKEADAFHAEVQPLSGKSMRQSGQTNVNGDKTDRYDFSAYPFVAGQPQPQLPPSLNTVPSYTTQDHYAATTSPDNKDSEGFDPSAIQNFGYESRGLNLNTWQYQGDNGPLGFANQHQRQKHSLAKNSPPIHNSPALNFVPQENQGLAKKGTVLMVTPQIRFTQPEEEKTFGDALQTEMGNVQPLYIADQKATATPLPVSESKIIGLATQNPQPLDRLTITPYYSLSEEVDFFRRENRPSLSRYEPMGLEQQESYSPIVENEFLSPADQPYSTFSIDVDTGAYANVRRYLHNNALPPKDAVRLEELINSFEYQFKQPDAQHPVAITLDSAVCPWDETHQLVRIGVQAKAINVEKRPATSLVFLIDVSGSMKDANKLPLAQAALRLLVEQMEENDRIAIVTYANDAQIALESTDGSQKDVILSKIDSLGADGSTNGEGGIQLAYKIATENQIKEGSNRVLLCTDGDFNVGTSDDDGVFKLIEEHRKSGVFLSVLGFGTGNLKDGKLEGIANRGNGHYSYIDRLAEAQNVLVKHLTGTLYTVAKDVKLQVEFNPTKVESYRLLGYENRAMATKDFNNDNVDAGEMGAGHTVTALYEIAMIGAKAKPQEGVDAPRYQQKSELKSELKPEDKPADSTDPAADTVHGEELLFVKLRYKEPQSDESVRIEVPLLNEGDQTPSSNDLAWASTVASFGMLLRDSKFKGTATWDSLLEQARDAMQDHSTPERVEFVDLVLRARGLWRKANGHESQQPVHLLSLEAREKAACDGRYKDLLDKFERPDDLYAYGDFYDFGQRNGEQFLGKQGVPDGYWVYVYPNWYVWSEKE